MMNPEFAWICRFAKGPSCFLECCGNISFQPTSMSNRFRTIPRNKTVLIVQELLLTPQGPKVEHVHRKPRPLKKHRKRKPLTLDDNNVTLPTAQPPTKEVSDCQKLQPEEDCHWVEDEDQGFNNVFIPSSKKTKVCYFTFMHVNHLPNPFISPNMII